MQAAKKVICKQSGSAVKIHDTRYIHDVYTLMVPPHPQSQHNTVTESHTCSEYHG